MSQDFSWVKVLTKPHVLAVVLFMTLSIGFIDWQIYYQTYRLPKYLGFNFLSFMTSYCILKTIKTNPGRVPLIWDSQRQKVRKYCLLCHNFKPDRTHHCSRCEQCVLNMDHHCPWLDNCIGFHNRKSFILAIMYGWLMFAMGIFLCIVKLLNFRTLHVEDILFFLVPLVINCVTLVMVTIFLRFHLNLMLDNMTTVEYLDKQRSLFPSTSVNVFDLGWFKNTQQVMGTKVSTCLIPTNIETDVEFGDGIQWQYNTNIDELQDQNRLFNSLTSNSILDDNRQNFQSSIPLQNEQRKALQGNSRYQ